MYSNAPCATRTLRELRLPPLVHDPRGAPVRRGLYVDCETTGLDWERDEIIEVGMLPFTYTAEGRVAAVLHDEAQTHLRDPGRPISVEITALTGLTDDDVRGQHIDVEVASALIRRSNVLIAHNARFDRALLQSPAAWLSVCVVSSERLRHERIQGTPLPGGNCALGRTLVLPLRGQLPRPRSDDDRARRRGRSLHDLSLGAAIRSRNGETAALAVASAAVDELAN